MDYGGGHIKRQAFAAYRCLVIGQSLWAYRLNLRLQTVRPLCLWHNSATAAAIAACGAI